MGIAPVERVAMKSSPGKHSSSIFALFCVFLLFAIAQQSARAQAARVFIVVGAPGEEEFETNFLHQAEQWKTTASRAGGSPLLIGSTRDEQKDDCSLLKSALDDEQKDGPGQLWLVLIGHGTFDGKTARFNLRGPDFSAAELAEWLAPFTRPVVVINTASASAPFINALSRSNRIVIAATRSGHEENYTRFGQYLAESLTGAENDLDKDGQVSVLEAFLCASRKTAEFYKSEGRIATEHALLDDNGDQLGTPADWFRGIRAVKKPTDKAGIDGLLARQVALVPSEAERHWTAEQRAQRDALERAVILHRERASQLSPEEYYEELEPLLLDLARFYASNAPASPLSH
jgi:hypothetical protein